MFFHPAAGIIIPAQAREAIADAQATRECQVIEKQLRPTMKLPQRDLLVLLRTESMSEHAIEAHVEQLSTVLRSVENSAAFCVATELVKRNRITRKSRQILSAARYSTLKPFHFLLNKN